MLLESDVVNAVCGKLCELGYSIKYACATTEHGFDIVAQKRAQKMIRLYVEVKGETSSQSVSKRYGKPFSMGQARSHVGQALYKSAEAASLKQGEVDVRVGIGLPDNPQHRDVVSKIEPALTEWQIAVFWVDSDGRVTIESSWPI